MKKILIGAGVALGILGLASAALNKFTKNYKNFHEYLMKGGK